MIEVGLHVNLNTHKASLITMYYFETDIGFKSGFCIHNISTRHIVRAIIKLHRPLSQFNNITLCNLSNSNH